jgi:hypothetical protein
MEANRAYVQTTPHARSDFVMKTTILASVAAALAMPMAFAADEPAKEKTLLQKTGDSLESGARKTGETLKKVGDKAVDLVTTSEEEKKKDAEADALKKATDRKADKTKNDAKADAAKKAADDKAERIKKAGE